MKQHPDSPAVDTATSTASLEADLNPLPKPENALVAATRAEIALVPEHASAAPPATLHAPPLDAHGFDPAAYKWVPVLRKPRKNG